MTFDLVKYVIDGDERWVWQLHAADGKVAHSAGTFGSESEARSDVARVKKKMAGAKFARVQLTIPA